MKLLTHSNRSLLGVFSGFLVLVITIVVFFLSRWGVIHPPLDHSIEGVESGFLASPARIDSIEAKKQAWAALLDAHPYFTRPSRTPKEWRAIPRQDRPDLAMEQEYLMTMDPALGNVPYERLRRANKEMDLKMLEKSAIAGVDWEERGPDNVGGWVLGQHRH